MKKILLALVAVVLMASFASASVLQSANTLGAGKMGWLVAGEYDGNIWGGNETLIGGGGFLAYGVTNQLDIIGKVGYGAYGNMAAGVDSASVVMFGVAAKYQLLAENATNMPVSVAALVGYQPSTGTVNTALGSGQLTLGDLGVGAVVSKVMAPWVPYGALVYHSLTSNPGATTATNLEVVLGTQMLLSGSSAIIGEVSLNSNTPSGGASFTNTQISLGYTAKI